MTPRAASVAVAAGGPGETWIVCGGRDYAYGARVWDVLDGLAYKRGSLPSLLRHGGAEGADFHAAKWARARGVPTQRYPADWRSFGRSAGPIRNAAMLADGADLVIAFPGGSGTADMIRKAETAGITVIPA